MLKTQTEVAAALNNAHWCTAMWASHGLHSEHAHGLLLTRSCPPPLYPNAVAIDPSDDAERVSFLAALAHSSSAFAVKDSFGVLDLQGSGFRLLFEARWLWQLWDRDVGSAVVWRRVRSGDELASWEEAWRGKAPGPIGLFRPALLDNPNVFVLGGYDAHARVVAGGIAFGFAGVLGVTNLFGNIDGFFSAAVRESDTPLIVRYEAGDDLSPALADGFVDAGPLRVWAYSASSI